MNVVFADTSYFVALIQPRDEYHQQATAISALSEPEIVTTQWVLVELANFCSLPKQRADFDFLVDELLQDAVLFPATDEWFLRGRQVFSARRDKQWSLTDCISFEVMRDMNLSQALTTDHHFEQAGFVALLK